MQTYELLVRNRSISGNSPDMTLVRTSIGVDQVHVLFDNREWLDFPVKATFAGSGRTITKTIIVTEVTDSEWAAESTVVIPWEVIERAGVIEVTLQGTDSDGNHIITAKGAPLTVEEAGEVVDGDQPDDAPSASEWQQAYSDAMDAVSRATDAINALQGRVDAIVADATARIEALVDIPIASQSSAGTIVVGDGLTIDENGRLSIKEITVDVSTALMLAVKNLSKLARDTFDCTFDENGALMSAVMKPDLLPRATPESFGVVIPDGDTVTASEYGVLRSAISPATTEKAGVVIPDGTTITTDEDGVMAASTATASTLGVVRPDGTTITIDGNGILTATGSGIDGGYILPKASTDQLGGVMVDGETISVDESGVIRVTFEMADGMGF